MAYNRLTLFDCLLNQTSVTIPTLKKALKNSKISKKTKTKLFNELKLTNRNQTLTTALIAKSGVSKQVYYHAFNRQPISWKSAEIISNNLDIPIQAMNIINDHRGLSITS